MLTFILILIIIAIVVSIVEMIVPFIIAGIVIAIIVAIVKGLTEANDVGTSSLKDKSYSRGFTNENRVSFPSIKQKNVFDADPESYPQLQFCAKVKLLLKDNGFANVYDCSKGRVNITAIRNGKSIAVGCYKSEEYYRAGFLQMFVDGVENLNADGAVLISSGYFPTEIADMAIDNDIELWDVDYIKKLDERHL